MTSGIEGHIAGVAVGQAKGFVDALLGPTLERVRAWAKEKDLEDKLSLETLTRVFERYLQRSLTSAESLQSVVFPQRKLLMSMIYEPLTLEHHHGGRVNVRDLLRSPATSPSSPAHATIIDQAGMGKSTFSKYLVGEVCKTTPHVPLLYNLRHYEAAEPLTTVLRKAISPSFWEVHSIDSAS